MPYLGNTLADRFTTVSYQDLTGGSGTSFTLDHPAGSAQDIEVFVNNVRQEPGVAYTVAGTALTMTGSVASTDDFYVVFQGKAIQTVTPGADTVTTAMIQDNAVTMAKLATSGTLPALNGSALTGITTGKVLQVVHSSVTAGETFTSLAGGSNTSPNFTDTALNLSITPAATTSKILVLGSFYYDGPAGNTPATLRVERDIGGTSTAISLQLGRGNYVANMENTVWSASINDLDTPSTTSAITYTVQIGNPNTTAKTLYFNSNYYNAGMFESFLTALEIGA